MNVAMRHSVKVHVKIFCTCSIVYEPILFKTKEVTLVYSDCQNLNPTKFVTLGISKSIVVSGI